MEQTAPAAHRGGPRTACPHLIPAQHIYFWQTTGNRGTAKLWGLKYRISARIPGKLSVPCQPGRWKNRHPVRKGGPQSYQGLKYRASRAVYHVSQPPDH